MGKKPIERKCICQLCGGVASIESGRGVRSSKPVMSDTECMRCFMDLNNIEKAIKKAIKNIQKRRQ